MGTGKGKRDAVSILKDRLKKTNPRLEAQLEAERSNADVAQMIYDLRKEAGLTQSELAELVGTTQSAISRLEDADYKGHSLSILRRIAMALNVKLAVRMESRTPAHLKQRYAFQVTMERLRRVNKLTVDKLAERSGIDRDEIIALERNTAYQPSPRTLHALASIYGVSPRRLAVLAGAFGEAPSELTERASRFAALSESFASLSDEERQLLDELVVELKKEA